MLVKTKYSPQPDMVKWKYEYVADSVQGSKARKMDTISEATVTVSDIEFDADETSMDRMARVVAAAYGSALQAIGSGTAAQTAATTELDATVQWKCADDITRSVTISTLIDALEAAKNNMANEWL